ncbi:c-type cytochrome [Curvibacter sp. APW13]|uniref:c-type cytochrome n=1 Tax=Curvibacter sp. APW13 TaxID=3077236 RepID=UPI0028DE3D04|nr:c-type cytochrome [Curvibacter sp. APW13]MDT8989612.1 c-type cytochrome [Curvibacter sp. APW13]
MFESFIVPFRTVLASVLMCVVHSVFAAPFEDSMAQRTLACTGCHGAQGRAGPDGYYPRLAGKPQAYLYNQLLNLREGRRHYAPMQALLAPLPDAYLHDIAHYFSQLQVPYPAPSTPGVDAALLRRGRQLAQEGDPALGLPACAQCHGRSLTGTLPQVPGLLGLPRDYLNAQLGAWRTHQRQAHAPDCMAEVAQALQAQDVAAVTHWLASQPVPAHAAPQAQPTPWPQGVTPRRCGTAPVPAAVTALPQGKDAQVQQGAYLARLGNCASCHTAQGGALYAGQRPIETPFGVVYSSNLTSDASTGIGAWSSEDFWQALHHGRSRDGRLLSPAFPYTSFSRMTREDSDALLAFLKTVPAVVQPQRPHALAWPFGSQAALRVWRALYFSPQTYVPDTARSAAWNRGAYLVQGVGHCGECHTPRNALGGSTGEALSGARMPVGNWWAPSLRDAAAAGTPAGQRDATVRLLLSGMADHGQASGPMAEVVQGGTQYLRPDDAQALAEYLESLVPQGVVAPAPRGTTLSASQHAEGEALYRKHCADCHGTAGEGVAGAYPALAGSRAVQSAQPNNLIYTVLHGGFAPVTQRNPRPFGMPPFVLTLSDAQVARVLSYVRQSWGNQARGVDEAQVTLARNQRGR